MSSSVSPSRRHHLVQNGLHAACSRLSVLPTRFEARGDARGPAPDAADSERIAVTIARKDLEAGYAAEADTWRRGTTHPQRDPARSGSPTARSRVATAPRTWSVRRAQARRSDGSDLTLSRVSHSPFRIGHTTLRIAGMRGSDLVLGGDRSGQPSAEWASRTATTSDATRRVLPRTQRPDRRRFGGASGASRSCMRPAPPRSPPR